MAIIITIDDLEIIEWTVSIEQRSVHVVYKLLTDLGDIYNHGAAKFWEVIPDPAAYPSDDPSTWYQLPAQYSQVLTDLTTDARNALLQLLD